MDPNKYNFYIGTSRGTLLSSKCDSKEIISHVNLENASETTALSFGRTEDEIITGHQDGTVNLYSILQNKYVKKLKKLEGEGNVCGIGCINKTVIVGKHDGVVNLWNKKDNDYFSINLDEKGTLECLALNSNRENIIGTGGEFNDFKLWDIETKQNIFKAKSLGHDELNLPIPTSVRGICFFPESENLSACATKEGHVLLYDDRAQRRPVVKFFEKKASFTCISTAFKERQCLAGTTKGYMIMLDMKTGKLLKTFTNYTGSITGICCDPVEPIVVTTSLDRFLRVHNLETKELLHKSYLKQNLTKLLVRPIVKDEPEEVNENKNAEVVDDEYEELFNNMETISDKKAKKDKRKSLSTNNIEKPAKSNKRKKIKLNET